MSATLPRRAGRRRPAAAALLAVLAALTVVAMCPLPALASDPSRNSVTAHGPATDHGPAEGMALASPLLGGAATTSGAGYWLVAGDGGVFSFGDAVFHGSTGAMTLNRPVVGMAAHPERSGYWLVAADGGVFAFGAAPFHGSTGAITLNQRVVGMASSPTGDGYWLVAADGGVFAFGDARFFGSTGALALEQPIVGMAATVDGKGYWLVAADGGVFAFGSAAFHDSMGGKELPAPVTGIAAAPDGNGYWLAGRDGQVYEFGVPDHGSAAETEGDAVRPATVGIVASPAGGYWLVHGALPTFEVQDRGAHVRRLQERLSALGFWLGPIDGVYGQLTVQAVYAFEKYHGLPVDGTADPQVRRRLDAAPRPMARTTAGDAIEVDRSRQLLLVVRGGELRWIFNTSTGTEEPYTHEGVRYLADTPPGRREVFRQVDGVRQSNLGRLYRPKYFHVDGIAVHGYPFVPPYPISHGCVRVTNPAIDFIWANDLMPIGTLVWVYGTPPPSA